MLARMIVHAVPDASWLGVDDEFLLASRVDACLVAETFQTHLTLVLSSDAKHARLRARIFGCRSLHLSAGRTWSLHGSIVADPGPAILNRTDLDLARIALALPPVLVRSYPLVQIASYTLSCWENSSMLTSSAPQFLAAVAVSASVASAAAAVVVAPPPFLLPQIANVDTEKPG